MALSSKIRSLMTSKSTDWYTPSSVLDLVTETMGGIGLDPAADLGHRALTRCHFDINDDGLKQSWSASSLFLNPPYGSGIGDWILKLANECGCGWIGQAIARFVRLWHKKGCMYLPVYDTGGE